MHYNSNLFLFFGSSWMNRANHKVQYHSHWKEHSLGQRSNHLAAGAFDSHNGLVVLSELFLNVKVSNGERIGTESISPRRHSVTV
eukprot:CFRG4889T1